MRKLLGLMAVILAMGASAALAHGPSRLKTEQTVLLNAPVAEVWAAIGNFADMSWFPGTLSTLAEGDQKGAMRKRTLEGGIEIEEELLKIDADKYAISTRLVADNLEAVKATNYASHITLKDEGGKTRLNWRGAFYRAFPQNDPPADLNDDASTAAVEALHQTAIDALVARFGSSE